MLSFFCFSLTGDLPPAVHSKAKVKLVQLALWLTLDWDCR